MLPQYALRSLDPCVRGLSQHRSASSASSTVPVSLHGIVTLHDLGDLAFDTSRDGEFTARDIASRLPPVLETIDTLDDALRLMETEREGNHRRCRQSDIDDADGLGPASRRDDGLQRRAHGEIS